MSERLGTTITKHIMANQQLYHPGASGEFSSLLSELVVAGKVISRAVNKGALVDILGQTGEINVQGETVQKLDEFANTVIYEKMDHTGYLCAMASEEVENIIPIPDKHPQGGKYTLAFDPLDGSSNIDVNVGIGTIFSIHRKVTTNPKGDIKDFLQPGYKQICAGYILYGPATMLIYSAGKGVYGFTLDPTIGEFLLTHPNIKIPEQGSIYSVNEGNRSEWTQNVKDLIEYFKQDDKSKSFPYKSRYVGSFVSDFHRNLLKGGVYIYPEGKNGQGKLRLLYEAAPMAFIAEQAGGAAIDSKGRRILDIIPESLHERISLFIGGRNDIDTCKEFLLRSP